MDFTYEFLGGHNSSHNTITFKRGDYEMANVEGILKKKKGLENISIHKRYKKGQVEKIVYLFFIF